MHFSFLMEFKKMSWDVIYISLPTYQRIQLNILIHLNLTIRLKFHTTKTKTKKNK